MKLNLGCGAQTPAGWLNVDYALGARLAKLPLFRLVNRRLQLFEMEWDDRILLHDLTTPFPWPDGSAETAYSSHTLEHMSREDGRAFLRQCHRVLRPGGILRIVVPDLNELVERYTSGSLVADDFVEALGVLPEATDSGLKRRLAPWLSYPHRCMYDVASLTRALDSAGFDAAARKGFDSAIADIESVELADRVVGAVIVEGARRAG